MTARQRSVCWRGSLGVPAVFLACLLGTRFVVAQGVSLTPGTTDPPGAVRLTVKEGVVSLEAHDASVVAIFAELERQTGIVVENHLGAEEKVTTQFKDVPLEEAIKRVAENVAIVYTKDPGAPTQRITKVALYPRGHKQASQPDQGGAPPKAAPEKKTATPPKPFQFNFDPSQYEEKPK